MDEKRFDEWNELKKTLHGSNNAPFFKEREIRWYAAGENIGREINGKGVRFSRPILIVRKYGSESFFGVPLSTKKHAGMWYKKIIVRNIKGIALLSQASSFSAKRLFNKIDKISQKDFEEIINALSIVLFKK